MVKLDNKKQNVQMGQRLANTEQRFLPVSDGNVFYQVSGRCLNA